MTRVTPQILRVPYLLTDRHQDVRYSIGSPSENRGVFLKFTSMHHIEAAEEIRCESWASSVLAIGQAAERHFKLVISRLYDFH